MDRSRWYIEYRINQLQNQQKELRKCQAPNARFDYATIEKYLLNKGALKELHRLLEHLNRL